MTGYVIENCEKQICPDCHEKLTLLCTDMIRAVGPWFYICFACKKVFQIGKGPVEVFPRK